MKNQKSTARILYELTGHNDADILKAIRYIELTDSTSQRQDMTGAELVSLAKFSKIYPGTATDLAYRLGLARGYRIARRNSH